MNSTQAWDMARLYLQRGKITEAEGLLQHMGIADRRLMKKQIEAVKQKSAA